MRLKRLELAGFKSFAKPTSLEFKTKITAIVGPNGSGKSNCAEGMRWVLGEQSMKSLRAKLGEDLIFNGSTTLPRMSKASVTLFFDNSKKDFPLGFDEVGVGRRVYRDGVNEYLLNGSKTRLKDIVELLANIGIGLSQHNIIGQGEADRILHVSHKERKEMIEDALGLKAYHIKLLEAERKLLKCEENMKQVRALRKEIQPHLKFLKTQVEKIKKSAEYRKDLKEKYRTYLFSEEVFLEKKTEELKGKKNTPEQKLKELYARKDEFSSRPITQDKTEDGSVADELEKIKKEISDIRGNKTRLDRDLGRLEGMIEVEESRGQDEEGEDVVARSEIETLLIEVEENISAALEESVLDQIHEFLRDALGSVSSFLNRLDNLPSKESSSLRVEELTREKNKVTETISRIKEKEGELVKREKELGGNLYERERHLREMDRALYELSSEENALKDQLRSIDFEAERINLRREDFLREKQEAERYNVDMSGDRQKEAPISEDEREKLRKDIDRLKFRLEESGGMDSGILKEYNEVEERDKFFESEMGDLEKASVELNNLSKELLEKIETEFEEGIDKINKEFNNFFGDMFSGGKAELRLLKNKKGAKKKDDPEVDDIHSEDNNEEGIEVKVNLLRKKIQSLEMLSGGERALTSIALLFALSSVNPPPFLVLDEIDAALDEANSHRYGKMLEDLSEGTQLVLITHNRESMKRAGVLYGITMSGDGTSKLLSLKLEEASEIAR
ncbi:MAG: hypothetical protein COU46_01500 [Candidatus Niyogibacteria bacterium CG10_big_fil_rev_8_21_14_0_10_42_19]|uniref:RecF/RecN/SMC N-terminal domain-containing protein n=1 Tax=Candidatus Niyogibacteria bacterium CG10_big_fil_rev_8_21_14_0_10_42_19 TaxID=1974725 RepID=A0A2H0TFY7_9BACT|nr:MAG: hypothetical protein COU46_01500 [Candidatus Niyogibacteria bacterium CG10_big_fil_rev_8_21_14_0_10_42_19]